MMDTSGMGWWALRMALIAGGERIANAGWIGAGDVEPLVGALLTVLGIAWSGYVTWAGRRQAAEPR